MDYESEGKQTSKEICLVGFVKKRVRKLGRMKIGGIYRYPSGLALPHLIFQYFD